MGKSRNTSEEEKDEFRLEEIIDQKVSLDTDVMDFLLVAGWDYWKSPIYEKADNDTRQSIKRYLRRRRKTILKSEKNRERRFSHCCTSEIGYGKQFRTLGELKTIIESKGLRIPNVGYNVLSHFNKTLSGYGIEPFKIGVGDRKYKPAELRKLKKYGLDPKE